MLDDVASEEAAATYDEDLAQRFFRHIPRNQRSIECEDKVKRLEGMVEENVKRESEK